MRATHIHSVQRIVPQPEFDFSGLNVLIWVPYSSGSQPVVHDPFGVAYQIITLPFIIEE